MNTLFRSSAKRLLVALLTLVSLTAGVSAQTASDYHTPTGIAPGAPAGSYALSNFEHINLFNGGLNFRLPLLEVGGRGGVSHTIWLPIDHRWEVGKIVECEGVACTTHTYVTDYRLKTPNTYYGPGKVIARHFGDKRIQCYQRTITRLTFQSPDGTEYDLRDTHAWGRFYETMSCDESVVTRGKIFKSVDGSSITFISDTEIKDKKFALAALSLNGWLKFADGTKYRVTNDLITLAIDRNGNRIKFEYDTKRRISKMTDSLDRQVTITYEVPNGLPNGNEDQIRYTGFDAAAPRLIRILSTTVGNAMHPDYTPRQMKNLFPGLSTSTAFPSARVVSSIVLPNNESYSFLYNDYGELARVVLPTGGRVEYKTEAGVGGGPSSGAVGWESPHDDGWWVYRRLVNRKVFSSAGTFIGETDYSKPEQQFTCGSKQCTSTAGLVEVTNKDAAGNRLAREKHYFYGSAARSYDTYPLHWPSWKEGREHAVETFDGSAAAASRRVEMTWKQRAVPWWTGTEDTAPPNNPQAAETRTTLLDTSPVKVSKSSSINPQTGEMAFDQYHNRTDFWEYDFGDNAAGPLLRHTRTQYVDSPAYTDPGVHLLSLPRIVTVYDAGGVERSRTEFEYDNYADDEYHKPLVPRDDISGLCTALDSLGCSNPAPAGFTTRGNVTAAIHHLLNNPDSQAGPATAYQQYDIAGNVVKAFDAGGHATTFVFDDRFGVPDAEATSNTAPVELGAQKSYGFVTSVVNALGHTTYAQYDYYTGEVVNTEDANGAVGSFHYADPLDRPSKAERAVNIP